ncbi:unnamed protein product [Boreogadus saida]
MSPEDIGCPELIRGHRGGVQASAPEEGGRLQQQQHGHPGPELRARCGGSFPSHDPGTRQERLHRQHHGGAEKEKQEKEEEEEEERGLGALGQSAFEGLLSKTSAFTHITPAVTPKKIQRLEVEEEETELGSFGLPELLLELSSTVTELASTLATTRQRKDDQLEEMHSTICDLQREQQAADSKHRDEVVQLTNQLSRLSGQVERANWLSSTKLSRMCSGSIDGAPGMRRE